MRSRLILATATLALLTTTLVGPGSPAAGSAGASAKDPSYGAPAVGQCFDMSKAELDQASYTEPPVDCAGEHTSEVVAVTAMPDGVGYDISVGKLTRIALKACRPAVEDRIGTHTFGLRLTAHLIGFFLPTAEQQAAGARWLRCDIVLQGTKRLLPLPADLNVGKFPFPKAVSRCLGGKRLLVTACSERHTYRATSVWKVRGKGYPSRREWVRAGSRLCPRGVTTPRNFRFTWSSKPAWKTGDRAVVCYSRTRR